MYLYIGSFTIFKNKCYKKALKYMSRVYKCMIPEGRLWVRSMKKDERHGDGSLHVYWAKWSARNSDRVLGTVGTSLVVTVLMSLLNLRLRPRLKRFHTGLGILVDVDTSNWTGRQYPNIPESDQAWNVFGWWYNAKKLDLDRPSVYALNMKVWHSKWVYGLTLNERFNE